MSETRIGPMASGRTTRMLMWAAEAAICGKRVIVLSATARQSRQLQERVTETWLEMGYSVDRLQDRLVLNNGGQVIFKIAGPAVEPPDSQLVVYDEVAIDHFAKERILGHLDHLRRQWNAIPTHEDYDE